MNAHIHQIPVVESDIIYYPFWLEHYASGASINNPNSHSRTQYWNKAINIQVELSRPQILPVTRLTGLLL